MGFVFVLVASGVVFVIACCFGCVCIALLVIFRWLFSFGLLLFCFSIFWLFSWADCVFYGFG